MLLPFQTVSLRAPSPNKPLNVVAPWEDNSPEGRTAPTEPRTCASPDCRCPRLFLLGSNLLAAHGRDLMCLTPSHSFPEHLSTNEICWLLTSFKKMKTQTAMIWVFRVQSKGVNDVLKYMRRQEPLWTSFKNPKPTQQTWTSSMTGVKVYSQVDFLLRLCVSKHIFL